MSYYFDLLFESPKKGDPIISETRGHFCIKSSHRDKQGHILLGHECMSKHEIDELVETFKKELEYLKKKAEKKFEH